MTIELSNHWEITDEEMFDDVEFAELALTFEGYASYQFESHVESVGDRLFNIHMNRGVNGEIAIGFETDAERTELHGMTVALSVPHRSMYLMNFHNLGDLTDDPDATGIDQARAVRAHIMRSYEELLRKTAVACALIVEDKEAKESE